MLVLECLNGLRVASWTCFGISWSCVWDPLDGSQEFLEAVITFVILCSWVMLWVAFYKAKLDFPRLPGGQGVRSTMCSTVLWPGSLPKGYEHTVFQKLFCQNAVDCVHVFQDQGARKLSGVVQLLSPIGFAICKNQQHAFRSGIADVDSTDDLSSGTAMSTGKRAL